MKKEDKSAVIEQLQDILGQYANWLLLKILCCVKH